jgi:hypothetical protein
VDRDRVRERERSAATAARAGVVERRLVEEHGVVGHLDVARERLGELAEVVLAHVERRAPDPRPVRDPVRHVDLVQRDAPDDRPHAAAVVVADVVQDESLTRVEADAEVPLLPFDLVVVAREARPLRLDEPQRLEPGARLLRVPGDRAVHRAHAGVRHVDHAWPLRSAHRDRDRQALDRPVVRVLLARPLEERQRAQQPRARRHVRQLDLAGRPDVEVDVVRVRDAARGDRVAPGLVGAHGGVGRLVLGVVDRGLHACPAREREHPRRVRAQVDDRLEGAVAGGLVDVGERLARERPAGRPRQQVGLARLLKRDEREERAGREARVVLDRADRRPDLAPGQRVERSRRGARRGRRERKDADGRLGRSPAEPVCRHRSPPIGVGLPTLSRPRRD